MEEHLQLQSSVELFDIAVAITKFNFRGALFKQIWRGNEEFQRDSS